MCRKHERRCATALALRDEALREWCGCETLHAVLACWGRLGGQITLHRYGREHYASMARSRWQRSQACG